MASRLTSRWTTDPTMWSRGKDAQLDRAIEEVMKQIEANPKKLPPRPPDLPAYPEGPAM